MELLWRLPLGLVGGLIALWTFPTENIWALAPVMVLVIAASVTGASFWAASLVGFVAGMAFYIAHIEWISQYLGPVPLIALSVLQSIYFALGLGVWAFLYSRLSKQKGFSSPLALSVVFASIWTAREWLANNFPYGGFPWSRLSMTQSDSILANYAFLGGMSLVSFLVAFIGILLYFAINTIRASNKLPIATGVAVIATFALAFLIPVGNTEKVGEIRIAAIQGNANAGLFANPDRGSILRNHISASELIPRSEIGAIDLIVWPENASDIDPLRNPDIQEEIEDYIAEYSAPLIFGTITERSGQVFNSSLYWDNQGLRDYYDKKRPVPFAEYVPHRDFYRIFAPDLIDLISRDYSFGIRDGIYELEEATAGTLICFEIAEDDIPRELVDQGSQIILSQTNNADFGFSDETYQQAAIAKLRAIETGRVVVNISTVGKSVIYDADGSTIDEVEWFEPAVMVETVDLREGKTPAMQFGLALEFMNLAAAAGLLVWSVRTKPRSRRKRKR
jgi:apolipoprotein N-acyltransferase